MYKVKAAKAEANIARYQLSDVKEKVELQVNQATFKVNEAGKKLAMATKNMEKAEENLRYAKLGFSEGVIPTSNVLEAQTAWLSAQSDKIDAQIDVKLTQVYLRKSMGTLTQQHFAGIHFTDGSHCSRVSDRFLHIGQRSRNYSGTS